MATMKPTLLELTQNILSAMNSDEVNSISDTAESLQVANAIQQTYWNMLGRYDLPEHNELFQLDPSLDTTTPCIMFRPEGCTRIEWIRYFDSNPVDSSTQSQFQHDVNVDIQSSFWSTTSTTSMTIGIGPQTFTVGSSTLTPVTTGQNVTMQSGINWMVGTLTSYIGTTMVVNVTSTMGAGTFSAWQVFAGSPAQAPGYKPVKILPIDVFIQQNQMMNLATDNVAAQQISIADPATGDSNIFQFLYRNDRQPCYCTILSNYYIIFDSYDNTQDTTLQKDKTMVWGWIYPTFQMEDDFVPDLDAQQFPLLLNDAKSLVFFEQKQFPHVKAEEEVGRQLVSLQKWKAIAGRVSDEKDMYFRELPNFGR